MDNKSKYYLIKIKPFHDEDGFLSVIEEERQIPFKIRRIFYEYGVKKNSLRGNHANLKSRFCMIAVSGSCDVIIKDFESGNLIEKIYHLDDACSVLYLDRMVWKTMTNFSEDCVLLVLSDSLYDKNEYVRDLDEYINILKDNN